MGLLTEKRSCAHDLGLSQDSRLLGKSKLKDLSSPRYDAGTYPTAGNPEHMGETNTRALHTFIL